jgi:hypothetical protein
MNEFPHPTRKVWTGGTSHTSGTPVQFVRLAAKVALPPKGRRDRQ